MLSSRITTLFAEPPPSRREPSSVAVSILLHCIAVVWLYFGLRHVPQINDQSFVRRFTVRLLKQDSIQEPRKRLSAGSATTRSSNKSAAQEVTAGGQPIPMPSLATDLAELRKHSQTLVQPDVPPDLALLQETPVPMVVRWAPDNAPEKAIVLPLPKVLTSADIRASLTPPNREQTPAEVKISASAFPTQMPTIPPSTTSPVRVRAPEPIKAIPESSSQSLAEPTPARVVSLSDLRLKEGSVTIPNANSLPSTTSSEPLVPGKATGGAQSGNGNPGNVPNGSGSGQSAAAVADKARQGGGGSTAQNGPDVFGASPVGSTGTGLGDEPSVTRISLPPDGQFGVVVVGSSLAEQYPEIVSVWGGRLVYTVYLHVGLGKNWILQYSLPRGTDGVATMNADRPEAPWPYDIIRPNLAPSDYTSDAIMVHGFVNVTGRFEHLAVAFPTEFAQAKFVLNALQRWKFRPARQDGQVTSVEVLLIIPEVTE